MNFNIYKINQEDLFTGEVNNLPSMVEPCHNPSISEMLLHPELMLQKRGVYDEGDKLEDIPDPWNNDLQNINPSDFIPPKSKTEVSSEVKNMPNDEPKGEERSSEPAGEE